MWDQVLKQYLSTGDLTVSIVLLHTECHILESYKMSPFQISFFCLVISTYVFFSVSFLDLIAHFRSMYHCLDVPIQL